MNKFSNFNDGRSDTATVEAFASVINAYDIWGDTPRVINIPPECWMTILLVDR